MDELAKMESDSDSKNKLVEALRQAARGRTRSKAARLREIFDEVEAAKASGVSHKTIVDALASRGLVFSPGTFEITRYRIAKERKAKNQQSEQKPHAHTEATSIEKGKPENPSANVTKGMAVKPEAANSGGKKERIAPELKGLVVRPDLSLDDEVYEQFRKKD